MSVLKSLDINLPQSEKKTLYRFLSLYIFLVTVILVLTTYLYFTLQKELIEQQKTILLNQYANEFLVQLKELKTDTTQTYPVDTSFHTSLYDSKYNLIYSTLSNPKKQLDKIVYDNNKIIRYIKNPSEYYKNTQYIIVEIINTQQWKNELLKTIFIYGSLFFIFMLVIGYFLLNLFLKPMKDTLHLLDRFIKDTTHELNTPISTIVTNIELIDKDNIKDNYLTKIINRIDIGAKTISNIYNDLTYLILDNKIISNNQNLLLEPIIQERIEYFKSLAKIKKIEIITSLNPNTTLFIDKIKISKVIDNILSNAIKYNKINGKITIILDENSISIKDTGKGINQEHIDSMFDRYSRFDKSVGGFGIGLNIVKIICDEYNLNIKIKSKIDEETVVTISW